MRSLGYEFARIRTRGVGLGNAQRFEALKSGFKAHFENECFIKRGLQDGRVGWHLMSADFKDKSFVSNERVLSVEILARDLKELSELKNECVSKTYALKGA